MQPQRRALSFIIAEYPLVGEITKDRENASSESSINTVTHKCYSFLFGLPNSLLVPSNPIPGIKKLQALHPKVFRNSMTK